MSATNGDEPGAGNEQSEPGGEESGDPTRTTTHRPGDDVVHPDAVKRTWDWRGDVLLGVLLFALVVAPVVVYFRPPALPWYVRLVLFPLLPAILLGVVAVWATTRP